MAEGEVGKHRKIFRRGPARLGLASNENLASLATTATAGTKGRVTSKQDARPIGESRNTLVGRTGWRPGSRRIARTKPTKSHEPHSFMGCRPRALAAPSAPYSSPPIP